MKTKSALRFLTASATIALTIGGQAFAQSAGESADEIVVTGSAIRGVAGTGSPAVTFGREEMQASGVATSSDMLRAVPQILSIGADENRLGGAQDAAANTTRTSAINIRGIGNEATLLLINGRRLAPNGVIKALSDPNVIPSSAIERLEVVVDGASAIYGSDAVAGVVNLITRRDFDGAETTVRYGFGDSIDQTVFSQTLGLSYGDFSLFAAYEHNERSRLEAADRAEFASQNRTSRGGSDARTNLAQPGNIVSGATRYPLPNGAGTGIAPASLVAGTANRFDEGLYADLLPDQERDSVFADLRWQATNNLELWAQGFYTRRSFDERTIPASGTLTVPNTNAYFVAPAALGAPASVSVEYRFAAEDPNPELIGWENVQQAALGATYDLPGDWQINAYASHSISRGFQRREGITNGAALTAALASNNPATAFNPFGNGSFNLTNNPGLVNIIMAERDTFGTFINQDYAITFDGPLFALPGGDVRLAFGVDHHDNVFRQTLNATNVLASGANQPKYVANQRDVQGAFFELFMPLIADQPLIESLDFSIAARYDHYSDFGDAVNPKVGVIWSPVGDLSLRASYGTSFRAPSLVDSAAQIHNIFIQNLNQPGGTVRGIFHNGGRAGLEPEDAETWSAGFDYRPSGALEGLEFSMTYYDVEYTNRIDVVPNTALNLAAVYAPYIQRRPAAGDVAGNNAFNAIVAAFLADPDLQSPIEAVTNINAIVDGRRANLGTLIQKGVDLSIGYSFESSIGDWRVGLDASQIMELQRQVAAGLPLLSVADRLDNPVDLHGRASLGWRLGGWSANAFVNYLDGYINTGVTPNVETDAYTTVDFSLAYRFGEESGEFLNGFRIALSGQNVLDEEPPIVINGTSSWDRQNVSPIGQFFAVELSKAW